MTTKSELTRWNPLTLEDETESADAWEPASAEEAENDLRALILWLSMPFGENEPVFAIELPDGRELVTGRKLQAVYRSVVGRKVPSSGTWHRCGECLSWLVRSEPIGPSPWDSETFVPPVAEAPRGLLGKIRDLLRK